MGNTNDNWRKRNWYWIAIGCLIIGLLIGYFVGESVEEKYLYIQPIKIEEPHPIMEK